MRQLTTLLAALLFSITIVSAQGIEVKFMGFYEKGDVSETSDPEYKLGNRFTKESTRYVAAYLKVRNKRYNIGSQSVKIVFKYFYANGTKFGEATVEANIPSTSSEYYLSRGFGYKNPGNWAKGKYNVIAYMDNEEIASSSFSITETGRVNSITSINFYEGDGTTTNTDKNYGERFDANTARYIYAELLIPNEHYNKFDWEVVLNVKYFLPSGALYIDYPITNKTMRKDFSSWTLAPSVGVSDGSPWQKGNYRVEVWQGERILKTGYFTMF